MVDGDGVHHVELQAVSFPSHFSDGNLTQWFERFESCATAFQHFLKAERIHLIEDFKLVSGTPSHTFAKIFFRYSTRKKHVRHIALNCTTTNANQMKISISSSTVLSRNSIKPTQSY